MENGTDRYLHKKFKKQLSSEPRTNHYAADHQTRNNNESVPTHSTNRNENSVNLSVLNYVKSSISNTLVSNDLLNARSNFKAEQSAKQYTTDKNDEQSTDISYIKVSVNQTELTSLVTTSSILQNTKDFFTTSTISNLESNVDNNPEPENGIQQKTDTVNEKGNSSGGKYVCTYCNLACSKPSVLQKHIRAHTNERPYPCISCGFSFKTRSNLYKHCRSRTHANRVMGNKAQEINTEIDTDSQSKLEINQNQTDEILRHPTEPNKDKNEYLKEVRQDIKTKPYKPRFHTANIYDNENTENSPQPNTISDKHANSELISLHINDLIDKNNSIVNISDPYLLKRRSSISESDNNDQHKYEQIQLKANDEQPLNLTNKNRKRCLSEVSEPTTQKSLIKELLLKNLYADTNTRCPHCKMIFQTVTELELHKIRNCKGMTKSGPRYSRSSSVNVASILTQNKNAFDNIPQLQNAVFPLKSPGPFLGKTRLVESDKSKSFSFEDGIQGVQFPQSDLMKTSQRYSLSALSASYDKIKKPPVKLFGGEVKITQTSGETKSFKIDGKDHEKYNNDGSYIEYVGKMSENRVVKSTLQSGGTVLQNNPTYNKQDSISSPDVIRVYDNTAVSPNIDIVNLEKTKFNFDNKQQDNYENDMRNLTRNKETTNGNLLNDTSYNKYPNIMDFSQNAAKLLVPNLKQLNLTIPGVPMPTKFIETASPLLTVYKSYANQLPPKNNPTYEQSLKIDVKDDYSYKQNVSPAFRKYEEFSNKPKQSENGNVNPMNLLVNGKVVRYVPGIPGPVVAETPMETVITTVQKRLQKPNIMITPVEGDGLLKKLEIPLEIKTEMQSPKNEIQKSPKSPKSKSPIQDSVSRKFARPNSLALKPSMSSLKQHHGLTPTMFNQILISPDTPRGAKKYNEHFLHGNYFSYLGLKSSTKPVYCTLNKTQPFYVPHFKKLSMYSEWRQQDHKSDKLYVSAYDSRQRPRRYTTAENDEADYSVHSSYKYTHNEIGTSKDDNTRTNSILGGYESNEDYTYIRGRGRGRYVCDQCGIRCKKPSMLKKHIRTHSNDRPYTCKHCNFSFKTKGNLTKHLKSKAHTKNSAASSSSSAQQSVPHSSDSDTDDSGMDSSDESSTRQQEHEAAYGLLSLSQKPTTSIHVNSDIGSPSSVSPSLSPTSTSNIEATTSFMNAEQLVHVSKTNYARNKILDQRTAIFTKISDTVTTSSINQTRQYMGKTNINRPLTYPYTSVNLPEDEKLSSDPSKIEECIDKPVERKNIIHFNVIKRYNPTTNNIYSNRTKEHSDKKEMLMEEHKERSIGEKTEFEDTNTFRKRKLVLQDHQQNYKVQKNNEEVMDLSKPPEKIDTVVNGSDQEHSKMKKYYETIESTKNAYNQRLNEETVAKQTAYRNNESYHQKEKDGNRIGYFIPEQPATIIDNRVKKVEYDNSAMETLADIATKQEKLEKNSVAKNVASEFLKLATKHEYPSGEDKGFMNSNKEVNEMVVKTEENKSCTICLKNFSKPSQLRLHMNIHYLERPFKCDSCSVSFRTKGHLQKHERSASHHNKLSSSPALSSSEPRPFKCGDCNIAFRIHGHLAKHLRSKMHIMKLECLAKIPFGLYAELERSNSLLTEINTADGDQCLDSLKMLAKKVFINDQSKLNQLEERSVDHIETDTES